MNITICSSGSLARLIAAAPLVTQTSAGQFSAEVPDGTTLGELIAALGCANQAIVCVLDGQSVPIDSRSTRALSDASLVALMPPIRAG